METLYIVDLDGVVFDFVRPLLAYAAGEGGPDLTIDDLTKPGFENWPTTEEWELEDWLDVFHQFEMDDDFGYQNLELIPDADKALAKIFKGGNLIIFITARERIFDLATVTALNNASILYDVIHFGVEDKADFIRVYHSQFKRLVMIEDQPRNINPCSKYIDKGYLIDWPYNRNEELEPNIQRVDSWAQILKTEEEEIKAAESDF